MRSLDEARLSWQELQRYGDLRELKEAVRLEANASIATSGLRSACWKAFLIFDTLDVSEWQRTLSSSRSAYNSLRSHFFRYIDNPDDIEASFDPLSQDAESSPWAQMQKDQELRAEILQDVERCMPENPYFRQPETQRMLLDILFVFCRLNPDVGYRQGMHEIVAPILWVVEREAIDIGRTSKALGEDGIIKAVFDAEHIEHDTFAIFGQAMQSAKTFYISEGPVSIASRSRHIFEDLLAKVDPDLKKHLESLDIVPQVFLIRWIRLLFGREFEFDGVLTLWDVIFAEDPSLELVNYVCIAMLLRIRWHLLDADYNAALGLLLKYPEQDKDIPPQTFGLDALYLTTHMTTEGGSYLVLQYTGRPLVTGRPTTPPALQRNITTYAIHNSDRRNRISPPRTPRQSRNIEAMLQNTAKNIYARGEKLGIGKAVRNAVDEVHRKAQEIRDVQTPSPARPGPGYLHDRIRDLELRNKRLSILLSGATNELWEYQKLVTGATTTEKSGQPDQDIVEKLSAAIAKVQFVQVYLDEPTLSLPDDDSRPPTAQTNVESAAAAAPTGSSSNDEKSALAKEVPSQQKPFSPTAFPASPTTAGLADPSTFEDFAEPSPALEPPATTTTTETNTASHTTEPKHLTASTPSLEPTKARSPRPTLEESPFSFMLGQESKASAAGDAGSPRARQKTNASLFGAGERSRSTSRKPTTTQETTDPLKNDDNEFDMSSLRRANKGTKK